MEIIALLRRFPLNRHAPIGCDGPYQRAARAEVDRKLPVDLTANGHRKLHIDVTIYGAGLYVRGVVSGHGHGNASVRSGRIQLAAFPPVSEQFHRQPAIASVPPAVTHKSIARSSAIQSVDFTVASLVRYA